MKQIWIYPISKKVDISDRLHGILCIYKVFWPPETTVALGKKVVKLADFTPWPPPEQVQLLNVEPQKIEPTKKYD